MRKLLNLESDLTLIFDSDERVAMALLDHLRTNRKKLLEDERDLILDTKDTLYLEQDDPNADLNFTIWKSDTTWQGFNKYGVYVDDKDAVKFVREI